MATSPTLGSYDPIFYAQEALIQLENALGMASRVHLGYDSERRSFGKGSVIEIRKPASFTAGNAPLTAIDLATTTTSLTLNQWKENKYKLSDKDLAHSEQRIIDDHIRPQAVSLADKIDIDLNALYVDIPAMVDMTTPALASTVNARKVLFDNKVPMTDGNLHFELDGAAEAAYLQIAAFTQHQGAGQLGVESQLRGSIATRFGVEHFANQNTPSHVSGTHSTTALLIDDASTTVGQVSVDLDAASVTGTLVPGDTFTVAGDTTKYVITNTTTASTNQFTAVTFLPGFVVAPADDAAVTVNAGLAAGTRVQNLMFHRNAFALATAPLSTMGNEMGAVIEVARDPITGLALRSRMYYDGLTSEVHVAMDVLYGVKTLDRDMAVRGAD